MTTPNDTPEPSLASAGSVGEMSLARYWSLMASDEERLTAEEIAAGWHFCMEWDGLLVGPGMEELEMCPQSCRK